MDRYGYIGIETLLNFCENSKGHAVTPNDFMMMKRVRVPGRKKGNWEPIIEANELGEPYQAGVYCSKCGEREIDEPNFCPNCGSDMRGEKDD